MNEIAVISDAHLGYRHRFKHSRLLDYEKAFLQAVQIAMSKNPKAVVFLGDILHHPRPDPASMRTAINVFKRVAETAPVVVCIGNHEIEGHLGTTYSPIYSDLHENIHVLSTEQTKFTLSLDGKQIVFHGFQFLRNKDLVESELRKITGRIDKSENTINILCLHQAVEGYLSPHEISRSLLREMAHHFDLILFGHVHKHQSVEEVFDITPAFYVGSTERISFNEAENSNGLLVFNDLDFRTPKFINVESSPMKRISRNVGSMSTSGINDLVGFIINENLDKKLLQINITADVSGDYLEINRDLSGNYPSFTVLDINVVPTTTEMKFQVDRQEITSEMIREYFSKSGLVDCADLEDLCVKLYEKYSNPDNPY